MATKKADEPKRYFIVNPGGAVHEVSKEHARIRIQTVGWRLATEDEIKAYLSQDIQRADAPIATPFKQTLAELDADDPPPANA